MEYLLDSRRGRRLKGNLHLHTTRSDGALSPEQAVAWYRQHGYDFAAITDHYVVTDVSGLSSDGFLTMRGYEMSADKTDLGQSLHLVALGIDEAVTYDNPRAIRAQVIIDELNQKGATVFLAHPYWSGLTAADMLPLQGLIGVEVFNTGCGTDLGKDLATVHWDNVLARGKRWWGFAVDDSHWRDPDAGGGWVMVEADLAEDAIIAALRAGRFYSSSGPDIYELSLDGGTLNVRCSPVSIINFVGMTQWGAQKRAANGDPLTEASYRLRDVERYVRVECIDAQGRKAWSNPIYL
jgi:hypothetical protein